MSRRTSHGSSPRGPRARGPRWSWSATSRAVGAGILVEQTAAHAVGVGPELLLVGAGMVLLAGRDGLDFVGMLLPRGAGPGAHERQQDSQGPSQGSP